MSVADELERSITDLAAAYVATAAAGAAQPAQKNFDNLPATIAAIDSAVAQGIPPFVIRSASNYSARDYRIDGNSVLVGAGLPSPENPHVIESVGNSNLLDPASFAQTSTGTYRCLSLGSSRPLVISVSDRDTSIDISGLFLGFTGNGINAANGVNWIVANGKITPMIDATGDYKTNDYGADAPMTFFSVYPATEAAWNKVFQRFNVQIEEGHTPTPYTPYGKYSIPILVSGGEEQATTTIILDEPLRRVGNARDYIDYRRQKVVRAISHFSFPISDMNNSEQYPGWTSAGIRDVVGEGIVTRLSTLTAYMTNLYGDTALNADGPVNINTISGDVLFIRPGFAGADHTQSYWKEHYPDLVLDLLICRPNPLEESIDLPALERFPGDLTVSIGTKIPPSEVFIKF